ncbi:MAG: GNAT family N-acetyltransferase [Candidatus Rokubacteria bacterium]|nr:GNAT family N-acetyltransferase [Candidatus Rokubacteria bacterium]MBI3825105.1 GNAT family N-acetyltransferase [Candidatus Rokubacteria bacterium]
MDVKSLSAADVAPRRAALVALLEDAVDSGASIGFLAPLNPGEADAYWGAVLAPLRDGSRRLLVAEGADGLVGTVQLDLAMRPNGLHRAEVAKLMVHTRARRHGLGRVLMLAVEDEARRLGRTTLVLDTRAGDPSERLYQALGWHRFGLVPRYAKSSSGALDASAFYFKLLDA